MPTRFLLDENVPSSVLKLLRKRRFDVTSIISGPGRGLTNGEVARLAINERRIILTLDSDFLALKRETLADVKVIFVDIHPRDPRRIMELIDKHLDECLAILEKTNVVTLNVEGPRREKKQN